MVSLAQLWLPVLLAAVFVFVVSSLVHMVFKWHNSDYLKFANEDEVRDAIRKENPAPGQYVLPYCGDMKQMGSEDMQRKFKEGPVGFLVLKTPCAPGMGSALIQWFLYTALIAFFAGYVAAHTLAPGTPYLKVFRVVGTVAFLAYSGGSVQAAIWMGKPWKSAFKEVFDGLLYGLVTAGAFGWLWPH